MDGQEHTRGDYLKALLNQKNNIRASNIPLLNPSIEQAANLDTTIQGNTGLAEPNAKTKSKNNDGFLKTLGFIDELAAKFGAGFVNGWEGILDLGATALGALGDATGWYDSSVFTDWAKQDMGAAAAEWTKEMFGLGSIYSRTKYGGWHNFGKELVEGGHDILDAAFFGVLGDGGRLDKDYREGADNYYGKTDELTGFGSFLGGAAHSIGMMLPAIMTAGASASSSAGSAANLTGSITRSGMTGYSATMATNAAKAASLTTLGLGAAGKGAEQMLNEGKSASQSLAFGVASGAAEVASEIVVGKALSFLGVGVNKVAGVIGGSKTTAKAGIKAMASELSKTMFEEGMEEVSTAILEPVLKEVFAGDKGEIAKSYKDIDFWLGTNGNFEESVLGQGISGAFVGGITGGISSIKAYNYSGSDVVKTAGLRADLANIDNQIKEMQSRKGFDSSSSKYNKLMNKRNEIFLEYSKSLKNISSDTEKINKFIEIADDPQEFLKAANVSSEEVLQKFVKDHLDNLSSVEKSNFYKDVNSMKEMLGLEDYQVELGDAKGDEAFIDKTNKQIIIDEKYLNNAGSEFAHEALIHAMWNKLGKGSQIKIANEIVKSDKAFAKQVADTYLDEEGSNRNKNTKGDYYRQELAAKYFQKMFTAQNSAREMSLIRKALTNSKGILEKIRNYFDTQLKSIKSNKAFNEWSNALKVFYNNYENGLGNKLFDAILSGNITKDIANYEGLVKEGIQYAEKYASKDVLYNKKDYNNYGWARANDVLTAAENSYIRSEIAKIDKLNSQYLKTPNGEFMIPINNKVVFTNGKMVNTKITQVIEILNFEEIENPYDYLEDIYEAQRQGIVISKENSSTFKRHILEDYSYENYRKSRENNRYSSKLNEREGNIGRIREDVYNSKKLSAKEQENIKRQSRNLAELEKNSKVANTNTKTIQDLYDSNGNKYQLKIDGNGYYLLNKTSHEKTLFKSRAEADSKIAELKLTETAQDFSTKENKKVDGKVKVEDKKPYVKYKNKTVYARTNTNELEQYKVKYKKDGDKKLYSLYKVSEDGSLKLFRSDFENVGYKDINNYFKTFTTVSNTIKGLNFDNQTNNKETTKVVENKKAETNKQSNKTLETNKASDKVAETKNTKTKVDTEIPVLKKAARQLTNTLNNVLSTNESDVRLVNTSSNLEEDIVKAKTKEEAFEAIAKTLSKSDFYLGGDNVNYNDFDGVALRLQADEELNNSVKNYLDVVFDPRKAVEVKQRFAELEKTLRAKAREMKARISQVKQINKAKNKLLSTAKANLEWTDDNKSNYSISLLSGLFDHLKASEGGYIADNEFALYLNNLIHEFTEENFKSDNSMVEYNPVLADLFLKIEDGLEVNKSLPSEKLKLIKQAIYTIRKMSNQAKSKYMKQFAPEANSTYNKVSGLKNKTSGLIGAVSKFLDLISPKYSQIYYYLGSSELGNKATYGIRAAENSARLYEGDKNQLIVDKIKELKISKELFKKSNFNGYMVTNDQLVFVYEALKTKANFEQADLHGFDFYDKKGIRHKLFEAGEAQKALETLEATLNDGLKKYGDFLKSELNGDIKKEYSEWYKNKYYAEPNNIDDYWQLSRTQDYATKVTKSVIGVGVFKRSIARTIGAQTSLLAVGATQMFQDYARELGKQMYVMPVYDDIIRTLNTKTSTGSTLKSELERIIGKDKFNYIKNTLDEIAGAKQVGGKGIAELITSGFTLKNLSFNVGTYLKQYLSLFTSNISTKNVIKGQFARMFGGETFKVELNTLVNEIGGIKYRSGVVEAELNNEGILNKVQEPASVGMKPIKAIDKYTVTTGLSALMVIGESQFGYKIGKAENIKFVKDHWTQFELSQIGNSALSRNLISQDALGKYLFGYMQGAQRAATGSTVTKLLQWERNKNFTKAQLEDVTTSTENVAKEKAEAYAKAKEAFDEKVEQLTKQGVPIKELDSNEEYVAELGKVQKAESEFVNAQSDYVTAKSDLQDFEDYETSGGKLIPIKTAEGLLAQGVLMTLINELVKHIKGKKDWDDWFDENTITEVFLNSTVGLIPVLNVITNALVKNYDIEIASATVVTDIIDFCKNLINIGSTSPNQLWKSGAEMFSDITGLSVDTFLGYITGAVRTFDPETALKMRNVLYGYSYNYNISQLKSAASQGKSKQVYRLQGIILDNYKVRNASTNVRSELSRLYKEGYTDVMPKNYVTNITNEDGETVRLSNNQIQTFRVYYDLGSKAVEKLMSLTEYKTSSDENKAKVIKRIYDYYHEFAKYKVTNNLTSNKMLKLLALSNGNIDIAKYALYLEQLSDIQETAFKSRKELVIAEINKIRGMSRAEKTLLMYLNGYSVKDSSKGLFRMALSGAGIKGKELNQFLN